MFRFIARRIVGCISLIVVWSGTITTTLYAEEHILWDETFFNRSKARLDDDFVLPMPCGGAMAFRRVVVPSDGSWLYDVKITIGGAPNPDLRYKEGKEDRYIAGTFTSKGDTHTRYYYIGKYETTVNQYDAVVHQDECRKPSIKGSKPKVNISWFDAVEFTRQYTEWLFKNAPEELPREESVHGFLRLPTEIEWEFAASGGRKLTKLKYQEAFPPEDRLFEYVWYSSTQSAAGKIKPVGLLAPNPLGLHDILGNVAEMVFGLFQLDHKGRPHGQSGGFVYRGGSIHTAEENVRVSERQESPYFDSRTGKAMRLSDVGFRVVISAPVIVSHRRLSRIQEEWPNLVEFKTVDGRKSARVAFNSMGNVARQTENDKLRNELENSKQDLETIFAELKESRDRTIKAVIRTGAFLGYMVNSYQSRIELAKTLIVAQNAWLSEANTELEYLSQRIKLEIGKTEDKARKKELQALLLQSQERFKKAQGEPDKAAAVLKNLKYQFKTSVNYYGDLVIDVAGDYSETVLVPKLEEVKVEFREKDSKYFIAYANLFVDHVADYRKDPDKVDASKWVEEVVNAIKGKKP